MKKTIILSLIAGSMMSCAQSDYVFDNTRKDATEFTANYNDSFLQKLDFEDNSDFENVDRGFIAPLNNGGDVKGLQSMSAMQFSQDKEAPKTVNPSLWRHSQLVNRGGLYEVVPNKIYQVRGQDLSNLTIFETKNGIVLYDICYSPLSLEECLKLYEEHRGKRPLKGIIVSHSHTDHYGGIRGVVDYGLATEEDLKTGKIPVVVPEGFVEHAASENAIFGNIMSRRSTYQYGFLLQKDGKGVITAALGPAVSGGDNGLPSDVVEITHKFESKVIDGVEFDFMLAPESEAPSEMFLYIPEWKAISGAEDVNQLQHNVYSMRGAKIRDAGAWGAYINDVMLKWGDEVQVQFGPHTWPAWGNKEVNEYYQNQADIYQSIHDQVAKLANQGLRPKDIVDQISISDNIMNKWENRGYYGDFENNVIATYVYNLGWFNANIAELAKHTDADAGKRYVDVIGGEDKVLEKGIEYYKKGDYRFVVDLLSNVVAYTSENTKVNLLLADAFEQLGYQEESTLARNWFLTSALELRKGGSLPQPVNTAGLDVLTNLPSDVVLTYMGDLINVQKSEKMGKVAFNLVLNGDEIYVEAENGLLRQKPGMVKKGLTTITTDNVSLFTLFGKKATISDLEKAGKLKIEGNANDLEKLFNVLDLDQKNNFNLVLPNN